MPVDNFHPLYEMHEKRAQRTRDAVEGGDAIKGRGTEYLPDPSGDTSQMPRVEQQEAQERYRAYKQRALYLGVTGRTHDGMVGAVFRKDPSVDLPAPIEHLKDDADGNGMGLAQFARGTISALLKEGREGILVDFPEAEDGLIRTQEQGRRRTREESRSLRPVFRAYSSANIINWRRKGDQLALVVLREPYEIGNDEFTHDWDWQYRVLTLDSDGLYVQRVFRGGSEVASAQPRDSLGRRWRFIPFAFVGAHNNNEHPDKPLLLDMADVNIAHYRNSADQEEAGFIAGQPMVHIDIGDLDGEEWDRLNPGGIKVGSRNGIQTKGGRMEMVQAEERNILNRLMEQKESQMLSIGARLIEQGGGNQTAEEVRAKSGTENATLATVTENANAAIVDCMEWALMFADANADVEQIEFELNREFYPEKADPQDVTARIQELDRGVIALSDYRAWRRRNGGIDPNRTDEEIDAEIQAGGALL